MNINFRLIFTIFFSLLDDIVIIVLIVLGMSLLGVETPRWYFAILALILILMNLIAYRLLSRNPTLGFENMVGKTGLVVESIKRKGTVRIGRELWQATARENIERGTEIAVVNQTGLKLTVAKKQ